jgi:hypothetical protein
MDTSKLNREIQLRCPTCAGMDFEDTNPGHGDCAIITCAACKLAVTREELEAANAENIDAHVQELGREAVAQVKVELGKLLENAFRGSSVIKVK